MEQHIEDYLDEIISQLPKSNNDTIKGYTTYTTANTQFVTKPKDYSEHLESIIESFAKFKLIQLTEFCGFLRLFSKSNID